MAEEDDRNTAESKKSESELARADPDNFFSNDDTQIQTDFPVQKPLLDSSISDAVNTSRNASSFEELKRRVEEQRTTFIRCQENVRQCRENIIALNGTSAKSIMEISMVPRPNITSTPIKQQTDLSQSQRQSLSVELLRMHRWRKEMIKEMEEREKQYSELEKSFQEMLAANKAGFVNLRHAFQGVQLDFSAFRSETLRNLRFAGDSIQQAIRRNVLMWDKFNMKTVTRTVHKLRRLRSTAIIEAQDSSRSELSLGDSSRNTEADNSRTVALNSIADTEPAIAQHTQDKVEALENGMRQCYIELNAILANLMDVPMELENSVCVSTSGCLALLQSVGKAVTQLKLAQKNVEQSLSETLLSLSEATSSHRQCAARYSLLEEEKKLLKGQLKKANEENAVVYEELDLLILRLTEATKAIETSYCTGAVAKDNRLLLEETASKDQETAQFNRKVKQDFDVLIEEKYRLASENETLATSVATLRADLARSKLQLETLEQTMNDDKCELSALKRERQKLVEKIAEAEVRFETALLVGKGNVDSNASRTILDHLEWENKSLLSEKHQLVRKIAQMERNLKAVESQNARLEERIINYQKASEKFQTELMQSESKMMEVTRKLQSCAIANNELNASIGILSEERNELENKLLQANSLISDWERKHNAVVAECNQLLSTVNLMREEVKTLEMQEAELHLLSSRLKSQIDELELGKAQCKVENGRLNSELVQLDRQLNDLQIQMEDLSKRYADSKEENVGLCDKVSVLNTLITEQNEALKLLEENNGLLMSENEGYAKSVERKDVCIKDLQQQLTSLTNTYAVQLSEADKLKEGLEQLAEEKSNLVAACMQKTVSLNESEQAVNLLNTEKNQLKQKLAESDSKLESVCDRNERLVDEMEAKEAKISSLSSKLERCRLDKGNLEKDWQECLTMSKTSETKVLTLQNKIDLLTAEKHNLAEEGQELRLQLHLCKQQCESEREARRDIENRCANMEITLDEAMVQMKDMQRIAATTRDSELEMKQRLDSMKTKKEQWVATCAEMKQNFSALAQEKAYLESTLRKEENERVFILSELEETIMREQELLQAVETMNRDRVALDQAVSNSESEKQMLVKEIQDLKNQIVIREQNMADKLSDISVRHQKDMQFLQEKRSDDKRLVTELRARISQLECELDNEKKKQELWIMHSAESLLDLQISWSNAHISGTLPADNQMSPDSN
uniref:Uncharacterized protein n=1 Tax=Trichuris muris TaxID=70415 RepID=A0A5S6Q7Q8_TRIMR